LHQLTSYIIVLIYLAEQIIQIPPFNHRLIIHLIDPHKHRRQVPTLISMQISYLHTLLLTTEIRNLLFLHLILILFDKIDDFAIILFNDP